MSESVSSEYRALVAAGRIEPDPAQEALLPVLDRLRVRIEERAKASKTSALGWLFGRREAAEPARGLYLWGQVGRGKTMLMDLFFAAAAVRQKKRVHFHAFMADVHERIHAFRQAEKRGGPSGDPIPAVARQIAGEAHLLCFDEFVVNDIADAMILGRLFEAMFGEGVVAVATSNVAPADLYADGLNRALFLPFIALLQARMEVLRLDSRTDFRLEKLGGAPVYYTPADAVAAQALDAIFARLTGDMTPRPATLAVHGRTVAVPRAAAGVARFGFADLCAQPLGASDYLAIAQAYHTVVLAQVPVMDDEQRNEAKRFITLIDVFYEQHVKIVVSAAATPMALYTGRTGREAFEFERTGSRLIEMQSREYLAAAHGSAEPRDAGDTGSLVET